MIKKTLVHLSCLGLLFSLAACGGSPEETVSPSNDESVAAPSTPNEMSEAASPNPPSSSAPASSSASSEPTEMEDPVLADEIPAALQGRWVTVADGETPGQCTEDVAAEGRIVEVEATKISSFAWYGDLKSVEESDANSIVATFDYADDSDTPLTVKMSLETDDDGQTLLLRDIGDDLNTEPTQYGRCPA